jgi:3-oxoacyl-[acyl-carrier-protein] synthase-3
MGTVIDRLDIARGGWRDRHRASHLAVAAAKTCLHRAGRAPGDVDLLINAGIYRDRNMGEPALAALIQQDIGANPEDPHDDGHGTSPSTSPTERAEFSPHCRSPTDSSDHTRSNAP